MRRLFRLISMAFGGASSALSVASFCGNCRGRFLIQLLSALASRCLRPRQRTKFDRSYRIWEQKLTDIGVNGWRHCTARLFTWHGDIDGDLLWRLEILRMYAFA